MTTEVERTRHQIAMLELEVRELRGQVARQAQRSDRHTKALDSYQLLSAGWLLATLQIGGALFLLALASSDKVATAAVPLLIAGVFTSFWTVFCAWES